MKYGLYSINNLLYRVKNDMCIKYKYLHNLNLHALNTLTYEYNVCVQYYNNIITFLGNCLHSLLLILYNNCLAYNYKEHTLCHEPLTICTARQIAHGTF